MKLSTKIAIETSVLAAVLASAILWATDTNLPDKTPVSAQSNAPAPVQLQSVAAAKTNPPTVLYVLPNVEVAIAGRARINGQEVRNVILVQAAAVDMERLGGRKMTVEVLAP